MAVPDFNRAQVLKLLQAAVPDGVIHDSAGLTPYECDGLTAIREVPWVVVLPRTETEVCEVLRVCHAHGVPVVPRGAELRVLRDDLLEIRL